jgi:hypothetical protein
MRCATGALVMAGKVSMMGTMSTDVVSRVVDHAVMCCMWTGSMLMIVEWVMR